MSFEDFYNNWSDKEDRLIAFDINSSIRKSEIIFDLLDNKYDFTSIIDFGCGFGKVIDSVCSKYKAAKGYGFDFSERAIHYAQDHFQTERINFYRLNSLDIDENIIFIKSVVGEKVDCIILVDILEHIPDCIKLLDSLSKTTDYFIVKLPIEENIFFNYFINKEYPSSRHSNGHLREFNVNNVHYFIRKIGLTPIIETIRAYDLKDAFPPIACELTLNAYIKRLVLKLITIISSFFLPRKIFLRLVGNGTYCCIAKYDKQHILLP